MNTWIKSTFGLSAAALLVLWATNGKDFIASIHAAWLFLLALSSEAPLGLGAFFLSLALAVFAMLFLRRHLPVDTHARALMIDIAGLLVGWGAMWVQMPTPFGTLLGLLAGFASPVAGRAVSALTHLVRPRPTTNPEV